MYNVLILDFIPSYACIES